jgi:hypothetical protein
MGLKCMLIATALILHASFLSAQSVDCKCAGVTSWSAIGKAQLDHYNFEYQSGFGADNLVYRLGNQNPKLVTPVIWRDGDDVLVEWILPRASDHKWQACPSRVSFDKPTKRPTILSYGGPNSDERKEKVGAYVPPRVKSWWPELRVSLKGMVADIASDNGVELDVSFSSRVIEKTNPAVVEYRLEFGKDSRILPFVTGDTRDRRDLYITWSDTARGDFGDELEDTSHDKTASVHTARVDGRGPNHVKVGLFALHRDNHILAAIRGSYYVPHEITVNRNRKQRKGVGAPE